MKAEGHDVANAKSFHHGKTGCVAVRKLLVPIPKNNLPGFRLIVFRDSDHGGRYVVKPVRRQVPPQAGQHQGVGFRNDKIGGEQALGCLYCVLEEQGRFLMVLIFAV